MKKETIKNVTLYLLIASSLFLAANIWFVKELWSTDYSSFLYSLQNIFTPDKTAGGSVNEVILRSEFQPVYITLTLNSKKIISYLGSDTFLDSEAVLNSILTAAVKNGTVTEVSDEDFKTAHKTNSILIRFMSSVNLIEYTKKGDTFFEQDKEAVSNSLIISVTDTKYIYYKDISSNKNYRIPVVYDDKKFRTKIQEIISKKQMSDSFAFELNQDKKKADTEQILFDSYAPMDISGSNISKLEVTPVFYSNQSGNPYDAVFKTFKIAKNSTSPYRDKENVINFIENHSTFKIFNDGSFLYEANKGYLGLAVSGNTESEGVLRFVNMLYRSSLPDSDSFLRLEGSENENDETIYSFNYVTDNGALYFTDKPAVTLTVRDGNIILYKQFLCSVNQTNSFVKATDVIKAYDFIYRIDLAEKKKDCTITNIFPANIYPSKIAWVAEFSDKTTVILE